MKIGIVSNSLSLYRPLLLNLLNAKNRAEVILYIGKSNDPEQNNAETVKFCNAAGIPLTIENNKQDLYNWHQLYQPDLVFFAGYGDIIQTRQFVDSKCSIYNIHFGKLPEFRGPSPVFWQLKKGEKDIGLSIHRMTDKLDSGPVVWEYKIPNQPHFTYDFVNQLFAELQVKGVIEILDQLSKKLLPVEIQQDEEKAVYYARPQLKDVVINWNEMSAEEIIDLIKACNSWNVGAAALINGLEIKILDATLIASVKSSYVPGTAVVNENSDFNVVCKGGKLLSIRYFKINNCFAPQRFAGAYGFKTGQRFLSMPTS